MGRRLALLIGNSHYDDPAFPTLVKAKADAHEMANVLGDQNIGGFKVALLIDEVVETMRQNIGSFFQQGEKDDFLLLYFSGHGDAWNRSRYLHLIGKNTPSGFSAAQVISATFIKEVMDLSVSKTQVLILDCCNSGAFVQGLKGTPQAGKETASLFAGSGHAVLTASSATQPAWEGDEATPQSLFTYYLVRGLATGEADKYKRGLITLDEWYEYAETGVINETSDQTPSKSIDKQQRSIIIAKNPLALQQASQPPPGKFAGSSFGQPAIPDPLRAAPSLPHPSPPQSSLGIRQTMPAQPAQRPIPPTISARPARRDAGIAASGVPLPVSPVTQTGQRLLSPLPPPATEAAKSTWPNPRRRRSNPTSTKEPEWPRISRRFLITTGAVVAGAFAVGETFPLISSLVASRALSTYRGHNGPVSALAWSPDGTYIASGDEGNGTSEPILWWYTLQVWDASTGRQMFTDRIDGNVTAVAWSPDGKRIASASGGPVGFQVPSPITNSQGATLGYSDNSTQVWDATTGAVVYIHDNNNYLVGAMAWSPDGTYIASTTERVSNNQQDSVPGVRVWDATSGKDVYIYRGHFDSEFSRFSALAWSPNSQRIASSFSYTDASNEEYAVQVWDALTGKHVYTYTGHADFVNAVAWSSDGKLIASGSGDKTVQVWDSTSGRHIYTYQGHSGSVNAVAWSPDGKRIVSGSSDGTAQVWDALTGKNAYTYRGHADFYWGHLTSGAPVNAVAWSPDGKLIASGSDDKTVQVWRSAGS